MKPDLSTLPRFTEQPFPPGPDVRTFWACPDVVELARSFADHAEPVHAMSVAQEQACGAFAAVAEEIALAGGEVLACCLGESERDLHDWSDERRWYPIRAKYAPGTAPQQQPCPYQRCTPLAPDLLDDASVLFRRALEALARGDFRTGWPLYEMRWHLPKAEGGMIPLAMPYWDGNLHKLGRSRLLVHAEQGAGDCIQFARYLPWLNDLNADLLCGTGLVDLFKSLNFTGTIASALPLADYDYHIPLCSLPLALDPHILELPRAPYLRVPKADYFRWKNKTAWGDKLKVGICWGGAASHDENGKRTMTIERVLAACPRDARLFSLQMGPPAEQLRYVPPSIVITDLTAELTSWAETAALIDTLDLIVTVDTGVAHLAGALGRPVKLLVGDPPEWRWAMDGERSRWYSSVVIERSR